MKTDSTPNIGIVVIGFNNLNGIKRLLASLDNLECDNDNVKLIISIDYSGDNSVQEYADRYVWNNGEKIVIQYPDNLGLRNHILKCGDYIEKYGLDAIIVLEDDIYVSPSVYLYAKQAVIFYADNDLIAGISLYKHEINLNAKHPFYELQDGGDTFFIQYAMSWGQIWMKKQWHDFKEWYDKSGWKKIPDELIPQNVKNWNKSWLKYHIMYCIEQNKFFVYPRVSLTTNFTDVGTHNTTTTTKMQVPMISFIKRKWCFNQLEDTMAVYDAFFENIKLAELLGIKECVIDLYGIKKVSSETRYLVTRKVLPFKVVRSWGLQLRPHELNLIYNCCGKDLYLYDLSIQEKNKKNKSHEQVLFEYDLKGVNVLNIQLAKYIFCRIKEKIKHMAHKK